MSRKMFIIGELSQKINMREMLQWETTIIITSKAGKVVREVREAATSKAVKEAATSNSNRGGAIRSQIISLIINQEGLRKAVAAGKVSRSPA